MVDRTESYEDAVARILDSEKRSMPHTGENIDAAGIMQSQETFFSAGDYGAGAANISRLVAKKGEAAAAALGLLAPSAGKTANVGLVRELEAEIEGFFADIKHEISGIEGRLGRDAGDARLSAQRPAAHGPGKLGGLFHKRAGKEAEAGGLVASGPKAARLVDLSVADQIAALEKIALEFYDKSRGDGELAEVKAEVLELNGKAAGERAAEGSGFEVKMLELRNQRLHEVMERLGMNNTS